MLYFCVICVRDSECFIFWDPQGHQDVRESITEIRDVGGHRL